MFSVPVGVHVLLMNDQKVLLIKRSNTGYADSVWSLPAGKIDGNETATQALCREAFEEIGIIIKPEDLLFKGLMHKIEYDNYENIAVFFITKIWINNITNKEPHKCTELAFFDINHLPTPLAPYIYAFFQKMYFNNILYGEYVTKKE